MSRAIPACLPPFLKAAEACKLTAYRDSAGVWTAGVGHTGPEVFAGLTVSQARADQWLAEDMAIAASRLALRVKDDVIAGLSDHQYAALLSFTFNLGTPGATIWKVVNARVFDQVPAQMMRFTKARDPKSGALKELPGLVNRRAAEVVLWKTADAAAAGQVAQTARAPSSGLTRAADTPPTPAPTKPLAQSKSFMTSAGAAITGGPVAAAVLGGPEAVKKVSETIAPYAGSSHWLQQVLQVLAVVTAALAVAGLGLMWLKNKRAAA